MQNIGANFVNTIEILYIFLFFYILFSITYKDKR